MIIHYEPVEREFTVYAVPVEADRRTLSDHLGEAPYFFLIRAGHPGNRVLEEKILGNPYIAEEKGKGIKVSRWLIENGVDKVFTRKSFNGKGPAYVFSSSEVDVIVTDARKIEEVRQKHLGAGASPRVPEEGNVQDA